VHSGNRARNRGIATKKVTEQKRPSELLRGIRGGVGGLLLRRCEM